MKSVLKKNIVIVLRTFLSIILHFSPNSAERGSKLWRVYGQLLLREIGYRHQVTPENPSAKPYKLYEKHLSSIPEQMLRFQNFMAQTKIFRFLLTSDWLETLSGNDREDVNSLLLRVRDTDNIYHSYRNNPVLVRRANALGIYDDDDMDFFEPEISEPSLTETKITVSAVKENKIVKPTVKSTLPNSSIRTEATPAKPGGLFAILGNTIGYVLILPLTFLLSSLVALPLFFIKPIRAWAARMKIGALVRYNRGPRDLAKRLSIYENSYTDTKQGVAQMGRLALRTNMFDKLVNSGWIDRVSETHRVMVSSLLRRLARDPSVAKSINSIATRQIIVHGASRLPQRNFKNDYHKLDLKLFGRSTGLKKNVTPAPDSEISKTTAIANGTSEQHVTNEKWFVTRGGGYANFSEALRMRYYDKAFSMYDDKAFIANLSGSEALNLLAFKKYMLKSVAKSSPIGRRHKDDDSLQVLFDRTKTPLEKRDVASNLLFGGAKSQGGSAIRSLWLKAQKHMLNSDDLEVSGVLEEIAAAYAKKPQNRISQRGVSFDTFLVTELYDILDNAKGWLDWHEEHPSVLISFAYCATLVGHSELINSLFRIIEGHKTIKPALKLAVANSYIGRGFHTKPAIASVNDLEALGEFKPLSLDKNERILCLVEVSAAIDDLFSLKGINENVVCAPVTPAESVKYPSVVTKVQIEDRIPMYSVEDMEISDEVDRLTDIAVKSVAKQFRDNATTSEWADFAEVVHANVFFSMYRDVMAVTLIEKMMTEIKSYDKVVFVLKNGIALNPFFKEVTKVIGAENVYFSLSSARKREQDSCVQAVLSGTPKIEQVSGAGKKDWRNGFSTWMTGVEEEHRADLDGKNDTPYALHLLEHINGYFDSYTSLVKENLAYSDVELITGVGHKQLNDYIESPAAQRLQKTHALTRYIPRRQPPPSNTWMPQLAATMDTCFDGVKSPLFPKYKPMISWRAQNFVSYRLAQVLDLAAYFKARFDIKEPTHVFTGPNQHLASRTASILGKRSGVPVYDFLILTVTNHKRYRPPVADVFYVYDEFYRNFYEKYFDAAPSAIRVSGPLFDYKKRFDQKSKLADKAGAKRHVVFFSQSGSYDVNVMILEDICKSLAGLQNVYLTVKLHPHESASNVENYANIAKEHGMANNVSVWHRDADAIDLVNQADLVVQSFSNVGLDAFLLKKSVITVKFAEESAASIFLYEKGVGKQVKTRAALRKATVNLLEDPKTKNAMAKKIAKFAKENKLYFEAENAKRVMKEVIADVNRNTL